VRPPYEIWRDLSHQLAALRENALLVFGEDSPAARDRRLLLDTVALGVIGAIVAQLFNGLLRAANNIFLGGLAGYVAPGLPNEGGAADAVVGPYGLWLIPVSIGLGGVIVGFLTERFAPEAEGHGTDTVIRSFHRADGFLRARVPAVKLLASALTIGSGGAAGREGPMALITGGIGSWYATITKREARERRVLLLVGMAAGLSAIFRSPIGAALLSVEILYADMEFEPGALLFSAIGAIVAYALNGMFVGWDPLFRVSSLIGTLPRTVDYLWYVVLGIAAGLMATALPMLFYKTRDAFRSSKIPPMWRPGVGALLTGLLALAFPQVIAGGYGWMQQAIDGRLALATLAILLVAKPVAMSLTVGSGGSGGVFAPTLFAGAMLGGACAALFHQAPAPFVVVGMAAVFAGAAHVPIATMMMVTEMTGGYHLLVPATLAVLISYLVQIRLSSRLQYRSVYEAQVQNRASSPAHHTAHLEIALSILRQRGMQDAPEGSTQEMLQPLRSGLPVPLPAGKRLVVAALKKTSPFVSKPIQDFLPGLQEHDTTIIAIIRGEHMMAPRHDLVVEAGDRAILVSTVSALDVVWKHFSPW